MSGCMVWAAAIAVGVLALLAAAQPLQAEGPGAVRTATGAMPQQGWALIIWHGGPVGEIRGAVVSAGGCTLRSVWSTDADGEFAGYIFGAPEFVQQSFLELHPGGELPELALLVLCEPPPPPSPWVAGVDLDAVYEYALQLINEARAAEGVAPVVLGTNTAAQRHAEDAAEHCVTSHWGSDGLLPYMRYSLAGGYHGNSENGSGRPASVSDCDEARGVPWSDATAIESHMDGLMRSSGHRVNILTPEWRQVSLGFGRRGDSTFFFQQFETDAVEFTELPSFDGTVLRFAGRTKGGVTPLWGGQAVALSYDPLPEPIPREQWSGTGSYGYGRGVVWLPLTRSSDEHSFEFSADLAAEMRGPGVYTIALRSRIDGAVRVVGRYSVFVHEAPGEPPPLIRPDTSRQLRELEITDGPSLDGTVLRIAGDVRTPFALDVRKPIATIYHLPTAVAWVRLKSLLTTVDIPRQAGIYGDGPLAEVYAPTPEPDERLGGGYGTSATPQLTALEFGHSDSAYGWAVDLGELLPSSGVVHVVLWQDRAGSGLRSLLRVSVAIPE